MGKSHSQALVEAIIAQRRHSEEFRHNQMEALLEREGHMGLWKERWDWDGCRQELLGPLLQQAGALGPRRALQVC